MSTAVYLDQIRQLVELQKVDDAIFAVRQELESAPRQLDELQAKFDASNAQRERIVEKLTHLQEQQKQMCIRDSPGPAGLRAHWPGPLPGKDSPAIPAGRSPEVRHEKAATA